MDMTTALWSALPSEILDHVLSFLPVPDLCRNRSVCKTWNRLICSRKFITLHAHNATKRRDPISFIVMSYSRRFRDRQTSGKAHDRWCILDLHARRWYKITSNDPHCVKKDCDIMAMDRGLVCQYLETKSQANSIIVHNPVANTAKVLPTAPDHFTSQSFPELSLIVDSASHTFKIVMINHSFNDKEALEDSTTPLDVRSMILNDPIVRIYESTSNAWKSMANPSWIYSGVGHIRRSVVVDGLLYVLFYHKKEYQLWRYDIMENVWENVAAPISGELKYPELIVSANRFFVVAWYCKRFCLAGDGSLKNSKVRRWYYKLFEIKVPGMTRETLFDHSKTKIMALFDVKSGVENSSESQYPRMSVFGFGSSLLFMSNSSGKLMAFDVDTRKWDVDWPQNPLGHLPDEHCSWVGEHMNLLLPNAIWYYLGRWSMLDVDGQGIGFSV